MIRYLLLVILITVGLSAFALSLPVTPTTPLPAPYARVYDAWLQISLNDLERDLPAITAAADLAAARVVHAKTKIGFDGEAAFLNDRGYRVGGLLATDWCNFDNEPALAEIGIVLIAPRTEHYALDLAKIKDYRAHGKMVIAFGAPDMLKRLRKDGARVDAVVTTHPAPGNGLFRTAAGAPIVVTEPVANVAALWVWTGEFIAACTRRGVMPEIMQAGWNPFDARTHKPTPSPSAPVPAGQYGHAYLQAVRQQFAAVRARELPQLAAVAETLAAARRQQRQIALFSVANIPLNYQKSVPADPGYFTPITMQWFDAPEQVTLTKGDLLLCIAPVALYQGDNWQRFAEKMRERGTTLVWMVGATPAEELATLPTEELVMKQHWSLPDAAITMAGTELAILPTSGVVTEAMFQMLNAELAGRLESISLPSAGKGGR